MTTSQKVRVRGPCDPASCALQPSGHHLPHSHRCLWTSQLVLVLSAIHSQVAHRATSQPGDGVGGGDISRSTVTGVEKGTLLQDVASSQSVY